MQNLDFNAGRSKVGKINCEVEEIQFPGYAPFKRGPYRGMYILRPWTIRQYAGFSTAEESNDFYRKNLAEGQKGLSVAFDLPTHRGYDSDHPRVAGDVGKAGVAIDSVEDMKVLFGGIPLNEMSVSMTMNGAVIPIMAFYIVAAEEQGARLQDLKGTIQNDILKEFMVRNTFIYPPDFSLRLIADIFEYTKSFMPKFNSISISGYHMHEAGAGAEVELAYTLADGWEYIKTGLNVGLSIDEFAPRLSFFWGIGKNHLEEIAKLRAGRILWAHIVNQFDPQNPKSLMLRAHCQTSGWSLTAQNPYNNLGRTTFEACSAIFGGTQSLHTNSFDEAISLPSEYSAGLARNTQKLLQNTDFVHSIDPFAGSYIVENMTNKLIAKAWELIEEVENHGGMAKSIELGIPKSRIERDAAKKQAEIDNNKEKILGLNILKLNENMDFPILEIDNEEVLQKQLKALQDLKAERDERKVKATLQQLKKAALGKENILKFAVEAARARATLGEISLILEQVGGRYTPKMHLVQGVYKSESMENIDYQNALNRSKLFSVKFGRQPRILVCKVGQDGHDRGAKVIASAFSDLGFDVDLGPLFQTPQEIVKQAIENDVHFIGVSTLAGGHRTLILEILELLQKENVDDILVVVGGIVPPKDVTILLEKGVFKVFGPGANIAKAAIELISGYSAMINSNET